MHRHVDDRSIASGLGRGAARIDAALSAPSVFGPVALAQTMHDSSPELMGTLGTASALPIGDVLADFGHRAVAVTKEVIVKSAEWSEAEMWKKQQELIRPVFSSKDAMEGATAFAEKRAPNWTGS